MNLKFFYNILQIFQIELLISAFVNFKFLKFGSGFGIVSLVLSVLTILVVVGVLVISTWKLKKLSDLKKDILKG